MEPAILRSHKGTSESVTVSDVESDVQKMLDVLSDADCRKILDAISADALTATEISDACNLPLSTTYRKVDILSDTELLEEKTRYCPSGKHANEYVRSVDGLIISLCNEESMDSMILDLYG